MRLYESESADIFENMGIPVLILEGDYVDIRGFNAEQVKTRLETFVEIVRDSRAAKRR